MRWTLICMSMVVGCREAPDLSPSKLSTDDLFSVGIEAAPEADEPPGVAVAVGAWSADDVEVVTDTCGLDDALLMFGVSPGDLLPSNFEVTGTDRGFTIQAQDYGADDSISCTVAGTRFDCSPQTVVPVDFYGFGSGGWVYEIRFSGQVVSAERIEGTATTSFPEIGRDWDSFARSYGIVLDDCQQAHELVLTTLPSG